MAGGSKSDLVGGPFRLDGRIALVTGGTRGTGRAIARDFAAAGASVFLTGRDGGEAQRVAREIAGEVGGNLVGLAYDAADGEGYRCLVAAVAEQTVRLDILVNNAAILKPHFVSRVEPDEFDLLFRVNTRSAFFLTRALQSLLKESGRASVVFLGAAGAHRPVEGIGVYCATKAAVRNFSMTLAREWAGDGIRVNMLTPGSIATEFILPKDEARREKFVADMASQNLLGRLADPLEIARCVRFLASDASSFVTASDLIVDGGFLS